MRNEAGCQWYQSIGFALSKFVQAHACERPKARQLRVLILIEYNNCIMYTINGI